MEIGRVQSSREHRIRFLVHLGLQFGQLVSSFQNIFSFLCIISDSLLQLYISVYLCSRRINACQFELILQYSSLNNSKASLKYKFSSCKECLDLLVQLRSCGFQQFKCAQIPFSSQIQVISNIILVGFQQKVKTPCKNLYLLICESCDSQIHYSKLNKC